MNFAIPFKNYERLALLLLWLLTAVSRADVDAGGGITSGGSIWNQSSIGSPIETGSNSSATYSVTSGMIEVLFTNSESSSNPDADTNGLPDAWEIQNFGHTGVDLLADADGDGTTNVMEYVAGTDPRSAASRFQPVGAYSGSLFTMPIETTTGRTYKVWVSTDLQSWTLRQTYTGDSSLKTFSFDHRTITSGPLAPATESPRYFFRVEVSQP
jgi:hypothetical protein